MISSFHHFPYLNREVQDRIDRLDCSSGHYVRYHRKDQEHGTDCKARACAQCSRSFLTFSIPRKRSWIQSAPPISLSIPPPPPSHRGLVLAVPDPNTPVVVIAISPRHPHDRNTAGLWHNDCPPLKYDQAHNQDYVHSGSPGLSPKALAFILS